VGLLTRRLSQEAATKRNGRGALAGERSSRKPEEGSGSPFGIAGWRITWTRVHANMSPGVALRMCRKGRAPVDTAPIRSLSPPLSILLPQLVVGDGYELGFSNETSVHGTGMFSQDGYSRRFRAVCNALRTKKPSELCGKKPVK